METIRFSKTGELTIPEQLRNNVQWQDGQELIVIRVGDSILLKPQKVFAKTTLDDVAACLYYEGLTKTLEEIEEGINIGLQKQWKA